LRGGARAWVRKRRRMAVVEPWMWDEMRHRWTGLIFAEWRREGEWTREGKKHPEGPLMREVTVRKRRR